MAVLKNEVDPVESLTGAALSIKPNVEHQALKAVKDIVFGSTAGILAKYVEYPFDTIKVRLQSQSDLPGASRLNGPLDALYAAFRAPEGPIRSLYRGISAPLLGAAVETSSLFFSYRIAQDAFIAASPALRKERDTNNGKVDLPFAILLGSGAASGAFTSLLLTPIELVKCKMQVPVESASGLSQRLPGPSQIMASILRNQGILGFWHGQMGTLIRETGGSAAWFGSYEGMKLMMVKYDNTLKSIEDISTWQQLCAGAAAGMSYNFICYPADTIKSRMQTEDVGVGKSRGTFMTVGKELWAQQGIKGFYRGCGITVARSAPSSAIIFSIYEGLKSYFG
jgi:mitochondrial ornithine carrier protein